MARWEAGRVADPAAAGEVAGGAVKVVGAAVAEAGAEVGAAAVVGEDPEERRLKSPTRGSRKSRLRPAAGTSS
jgi:hypothetical protein